MKHPEYSLQVAVCRYLTIKYPKILFLSDTVASIKLTKPQAIRNKSIQKTGFKTPDIIIFEPQQKYSAMFLELKIETPFKKDGTPKTTHIADQQQTINELIQKGYYANFGIGFDDCKKQIDEYLKCDK